MHSIGIKILCKRFRTLFMIINGIGDRKKIDISHINPDVMVVLLESLDLFKMIVKRRLL